MGAAGQELVRSLGAPEVVVQWVDDAFALAKTLKPRPAAGKAGRLRFTLASYCHDLGRKLHRIGLRATGLSDT